MEVPMSRKIKRLVVLTAVLVLSAAGQAHAISWVLALPPIKDKPDTSASDQTPDWIRDRLDRGAEVTQWQQGQVFPGGQACEDTRLKAQEDYGAAVRSVDPAQASDEQKERLLQLARRAFARCVPAFAFPERETRR
jgi:hypothetical protein